MSYQAVEWALYRCPMLSTEKGKPDSTARQVLVALAEHANEHGTNARPSVLRIRYATGFDERTIDRALRRLERGGLIARDGVTRDGVVRWKLDMSLCRPDADWAGLQAEADERRRVESERRRDRRRRSPSTVSGTQNPGHEHDRDDVSGTENAGQEPASEDVSGTQNPGVRHAESRRPARRIPASGTERPPNHPEPPLNLPGTSPGGTLPPDPLRPQDPPS